MRVLLGLLVAPLAPAAIAWLGTALSLPFETAAFVFASFIGYPVALFIGMPMYFAFRRRAWLEAWQVVFAGSIIGTLVPATIGFVVLAAVVLGGTSLTPSLMSEVAHKYSGLVLVGAVSGTICAAVFWLVAIAGSTLEKHIASHANSAP
jgi:hypothetical protein